MPQRTILWVTLLTVSTCGLACAQDAPRVPALRAGEQAQALFVASVPASGAKDESGKPAAATLDPVVFVVNGQLRACYSNGPAASEEAVPPIVEKTLKAFYTKGRQYPVWSGGASWGTASVLKSCMEEIGRGAADLEACVDALSLNDKPAQTAFKGLSWKGPALTATHANERRTATASERTAFLDQTARIYGDHHVPVKPNSIHISQVVHTRLSADAEALMASTVVQLAASKPHTLYTYRMFVVLERSAAAWHPVLAHFHRVTVQVASDAEMPKVGAIVSEEAATDLENFVDSFPLYAHEPDVIVTQHEYYEDWAYSLYRRVGNEYQLQYTGCGGGV